MNDIISNYDEFLKKCYGLNYSLHLDKMLNGHHILHINNGSKQIAQLTYLFYYLDMLDPIKKGDVSGLKTVYIESSETEIEFRGQNLNFVLKYILIDLCIADSVFILLTESISPISAHIDEKLGFIKINDNVLSEYAIYNTESKKGIFPDTIDISKGYFMYPLDENILGDDTGPFPKTVFTGIYVYDEKKGPYEYQYVVLLLRSTTNNSILYMRVTHYIIIFTDADSFIKQHLLISPEIQKKCNQYGSGSEYYQKYMKYKRKYNNLKYK